MPVRDFLPTENRELAELVDSLTGEFQIIPINCTVYIDREYYSDNMDPTLVAMGRKQGGYGSSQDAVPFQVTYLKVIYEHD